MKPDYDSVCSSIALLRILRAQFPDKKIQILFSEIWIDEWDDLYEEGDIVWIDEKNKQRRSPDEQPYNMFQYLNPSDMVIGIDGNSYDRFVPADSKYIREKLPFFQSITTALIDHHQGEPDKATVTYIDPEATSTCEIIATMFDEEMITNEIAMMLLWGILTDTGFFDFVRVHNVEVFDTVKMLFLKTACKSMEEVKQRFKTDEVTFDYLQVLHMNRQKVTSEENGIPMSLHSWINTYQYTDETKRELATGKSMFFGQLKRLERFSLYWIIAPTTKPHQYSIAFRSKEGIDVATLASDHFNGGGHTNAAGGRYTLTADEKTDIEKRKTVDPTFADGQYVSERVLKILTHEVSWNKYQV
jgi:phosphoesterase RecJ-like protein